jgi:hypothetical protein
VVTKKDIVDSLCSNVAAHVHAETIPTAIRPGLMLFSADKNSSVLFGSNEVYRFWIYVIRTCRKIMPKVKSNQRFLVETIVVYRWRH